MLLFGFSHFMLGRFCCDDPYFWDFQCNWVITIWLTPLSADKIRLSLSVLVPEILQVMLVSFFNKMHYLTFFKHFLSIFSLIFDPTDPLFHWSFYKTNWVQFFYCVLNQATKILVKYPLPPGRDITIKSSIMKQLQLWRQCDRH